MNGSDWPGRSEGLTDREAEVLALITQGMSNAAIADLTYLSPNTIKTYIRSIYRKIPVRPAGPRRCCGAWSTTSGPDKRPDRPLARRALTRQGAVMTTFLLLPGAGGEASYWGPVSRLLEQAGHDVVAVDLPCDDDSAGLET